MRESTRPSLLSLRIVRKQPPLQLSHRGSARCQTKGVLHCERERLGQQRNHTQVSCRPTTDAVNDSTREQVAKDFTWHKTRHLLPAEKLAAVAHSDSTQKWYTLTHTHTRTQSGKLPAETRTILNLIQN